MTGDEGGFKDCRQYSHLTLDGVKIRAEKNHKSYKSEILAFKESQENQKKVVENTFIIFCNGIGIFYTKMEFLNALCVSIATVFLRGHRT